MEKNLISALFVIYSVLTSKFFLHFIVNNKPVKNINIYFYQISYLGYTEKWYVFQVLYLKIIGITDIE